MVVSDRIQNLLKHEGPDLKQNEISLRISSEAIINLLNEIHPEALTFYYFMGMLPAGALPEHLLRMWGSSHEKCSGILKSFGMLECAGERCRLTPFMMTYADETISAEDK